MFSYEIGSEVHKTILRSCVIFFYHISVETEMFFMRNDEPAKDYLRASWHSYDKKHCPVSETAMPWVREFDNLQIKVVCIWTYLARKLWTLLPNPLFMINILIGRAIQEEHSVQTCTKEQACSQWILSNEGDICNHQGKPSQHGAWKALKWLVRMTQSNTTIAYCRYVVWLLINAHVQGLFLR